MRKLLKKIKRWSSRTRILAVSNDDAEVWLSSLGLLDNLNENKISCLVCGSPINIDNWQLVSRVKGQIVMCCDDALCIARFAEVVREKNK